MKLHYCHPDGRIIGDVMPLYDNGTYHLFYLVNGSGNDQIHHEHITSTDRVSWKRHAPSVYGKEYCAFTGSYWKDRDGLYRCFFTKWNPNDETGREHLAQAVSNDCFVWKELKWQLDPDGVIYSSARYRDFRDPDIRFNEEQHCYQMVLLANPATQPNDEQSWDEHWVWGQYQSTNLEDWEPLPPLQGPFADECPQLITSKAPFVVLGCHQYAAADHADGPYHVKGTLDQNCRAGKSLYDGYQRYWWGGFIGGPLSTPRMLYVKTNGVVHVSLDQTIAYPNCHSEIESIHTEWLIAVNPRAFTLHLSSDYPCEVEIIEQLTATHVLKHRAVSLNMYLILDEFLLEVDLGNGTVQTHQMTTQQPYYLIRSSRPIRMVQRTY